MEVTHFLGALLLLILFITSMVFYRRGLVHLTTLTFDVALAWFAVINEWEIVFFPLCVIIGIISAILFFWSMLKGDWL